MLPALLLTGCSPQPRGKSAAVSLAGLNKPSVTTAKGLQMTVRMTKAELLVGEKLEVIATFTNTSEKAFALFDLDFNIPYCLSFTDVDSGRTWKPSCMLLYDRIGGVSAALRPGGSYSAKGAVKLGDGWSFGAHDFLPPGNYEARLAMRLEAPGNARHIGGLRAVIGGQGAVTEFWSGVISSKPIRFAVRSNRNGTGDPVNQRMVKTFRKRITELGEKRLASKRGDFEAYRMFHFLEGRSDLYSLFQIEKQGERYRLVIRPWTGKGVTHSFDITRREWNEFKKRLGYACFWDVPAADHRRGRGGSHMWMEGFAGGERHLVYRWSGGSVAYWACARYLGRLVGRTLEQARVPLKLTIKSERAEYASWKDVVIYARLHNKGKKAVTMYTGNAQGRFGPQYVSFRLSLWNSRSTHALGHVRAGFMVSGWLKSHPMYVTIPAGGTSDPIPLKLAHSTVATGAQKLALKHYACYATFQDSRTQGPLHRSNTVRFRIK